MDLVNWISKYAHVCTVIATSGALLTQLDLKSGTRGYYLCR